VLDFTPKSERRRLSRDSDLRRCSFPEFGFEELVISGAKVMMSPVQWNIAPMFSFYDFCSRFGDENCAKDLGTEDLGQACLGKIEGCT
jgi:hypothetical protein